MKKIAAFLFAFATLIAIAQNPSPPAQTTDILQYIDQTWKVLRRSNRSLPTAAVDPKFQPEPDGRWPVYIPRSEALQKVEEQLRAEIPEASMKTIALRQLPENINQITEQGLLYLPKAYIVPGGWFNEMYGWTATSSKLACSATAISITPKTWPITSCIR